MAALFAAALAVSLLAWAVPAEITVWLGALPILFGLGMLVHPSGGEAPVPPAAGITAVASTTIANGSDNLVVYIPLFATGSGSDIAVIGATFAVMTVLWCLAARWLAGHPAAGAPLRRYGPKAVPYVLVGIGLWILLR
jgi:cadmium resistance protein CadD (predicted permease)